MQEYTQLPRGSLSYRVWWIVQTRGEKMCPRGIASRHHTANHRRKNKKPENIQGLKKLYSSIPEMQQHPKDPGNTFEDSVNHATDSSNQQQRFEASDYQRFALRPNIHFCGLWGFLTLTSSPSGREGNTTSGWARRSVAVSTCG